MRFNWSNPDKADWIPGWLAAGGLVIGAVEVGDFALRVCRAMGWI